MAETLVVSGNTRAEIYQHLLPQLESVLKDVSSSTAAMAQACACIRQALGFFWVGFYVVKNDSELEIGPYQGDVACSRIQKGKGVCGTAWLKRQTIIVPDVNTFPGHIACSPHSRSEIVIPVFNRQGDLCAVLDIDSVHLNDFSKEDTYYLEKITTLLSPFF
jgi:GAF domain-containing protein